MVFFFYCRFARIQLRSNQPLSKNARIFATIRSVFTFSKEQIMKVRKAVIPAAGLGTRFLPATKAMPKEMLPIVDKPTIQFIVEEAKKAGIEDI